MGIVLAGGAATRFGEDKLAYSLEGIPVVRRTFDAVSRIEPRPVVSVRRPSQIAKLQRLLPRGTKFLLDLRRGTISGPGAGILTGFHACGEERALVVAADMPWVEPEALGRLQGFATRRRPGVAVPLRSSGFVEPLVQAHAIAPSGEFLDRLIEGRARRLRPTDLLRSCEGVRLVPERRLTRQARCFQSLNTPEDLLPPVVTASSVGRPRTIPVPREASVRFWRATDRWVRGDREGAGLGYAAEAEVYREVGVPHLELHCLVDARALLSPGEDALVRLEGRLRRLRSGLASDGPSLGTEGVRIGARSAPRAPGPSGSR